MLKALLCAALTLPLLAQDPITRLACGACYKPKRDKGIWKTIAKDQPQAFLFMGDNVYADTEDMEEMKKSYSELTSLPDYAAFSKSVPIIPAWDDHDYGKNDAGREYPKRKEAQQIFFDAYQFPADHPARKSAGTYHSRIMGPDGKRLQIIVLDTRYFRSAPLSKKVFRHKTYLPQTDPTATMLGEAQWKWLEEELKKPAELRLIVSSIQLIMEHHRFEKWANFPREREKFLKLLKSTNAGPTILFSGDRHLAEVCRLKKEDTQLPFDLYELTSSGMTHAGSGKYKSSLRVPDTYYSKRNYGLIEIDWQQPKPKVDLSIKTFTGETANKTTVTF